MATTGSHEVKTTKQYLKRRKATTVLGDKVIAVQSNLNEHVEKVGTHANIADLMTKSLSQEKMLEHLGSMHFRLVPNMNKKPLMGMGENCSDSAE